MSRQSFPARIGMRLGILGSAASLAIAAPLADGDLSMDAHTSAERIGVWFDRSSGNEGTVFNVLGVDVLGVRADRIDFGVFAVLPASTEFVPSMIMPHGDTPTTPPDGAMWSTTAGFFGQVNGSTVQFGGGGGLANIASGVTGDTLTIAATLTDEATVTFRDGGGYAVLIDPILPVADAPLMWNSSLNTAVASTMISGFETQVWIPTAAPGEPSLGFMYFDSTLNRVRYYDGSTLITAAETQCANDFDSGPYDGMLQLSTIGGAFAVAPGLQWNEGIQQLEIPGSAQVSFVLFTPQESLGGSNPGEVAFDNNDLTLKYYDGSSWISCGGGLANIASNVSGGVLTIDAGLTGPHTVTFGDFDGIVAVVPSAEAGNEHPLMWNIAAQAAMPSVTIYNFETLEFTPAGEPSSPNGGVVYFDSGTSILRYYDGSTWIDLIAQAVTSVNGQTGDVTISPPGDSGEITFNDNGNWGSSDYLTTVVGADHGEITLGLDYLTGSSPTLNLDGYSGPGYDLAGRIVFKNNGADMWALWPNSVATGSDEGYDFRLVATGDGGSWDQDVFTVERKRGGDAVLNRPFTVNCDNGAESGYALNDVGMEVNYDLRTLSPLSGVGMAVNATLSGSTGGLQLVGIQSNVTSSPDCSTIYGMYAATSCSGTCDTSVGLYISGLATGATETWGIQIVPDVMSYLGIGVVVADDGAFYLGLPGVDGTWKFVRDGADLVIQKRESGVYVTKTTIEA